MHSFGRAIVSAVVAACALAPGWPVSAAPTQPRALYDGARAHEVALRKALDTRPTDTTLLPRMRTLVTTYEDLARLFPTSPYSDDALSRGGQLAADGYWQFGDPVDRTRALRLFDALTTRFPTSSLIPQAASHRARLERAGGDLGATRAPSAALKIPSPLGATTTPRLRGVRRELLPGVLRVTFEMDREAPFTADRLDGPARVVVDLRGARTVDSLIGHTFAYPDDVVQRVRVGKPDTSRTRVVMDLRGSARHSVYALYDPYRVIVDFERQPHPIVPPQSIVAAASQPTLPARRATLIVHDAPSVNGASTAPGLNGAPSAPVVSGTSSGPGATAAATVAPPAAPSLAPTPAPPSANARGGYSLSRQLGLGVTRVVIDPGHGGHDPGAKVKGLTEADLVLNVAQRLEKALKKQPGVDVVLTRRDDTYVALEERTAIANRANADLFLSIHANASTNPAAQGIETYFLNFATNDAAEAVAARENSASGRQMRELPEIVKAIALGNKVDESRDLAGMVQRSLVERLSQKGRAARNLGVKQAPFMVLIGATMPSVLAEVAFITNADEVGLVKTDKYRQQIADALLAAILRYQQSLKAVATLATR